jgi:ABC-2 type transport system permease protein
MDRLALYPDQPDLAGRCAQVAERDPGVTATSLARLYARTARAAMAGAAADPANLALQILGMAVNNGFMLVLWFMFFAGFRSVGGWRLADMALLIGLTMSIVGVAGVVFGGYRDMAATILGGEIDALLTQPRSVLARLLSRETIPSAWGDLIVSLAILTAFAGLGWRDLPWLAAGWTLGLIVYLSAATAFASLAFWLSGARSLARDLTDFVIVVSSYPGSVFSGASKLITYSLLPAGFIVLTPVALLRRPSLATLGAEVAATAAYAGLAAAVFHLGLRRYRRGSSVGGLG